MGLDTYARDANGKLPDDARSAFARSGVNLCGGMFSSRSGSGESGSFRGKVYAKLIKDTTGVDLYQEQIDTETVRLMAHNVSLAIQDLKQIQKFLDICVMYDLELWGSW